MTEWLDSFPSVKETKSLGWRYALLSSAASQPSVVVLVDQSEDYFVTVFVLSRTSRQNTTSLDLD